MSDDLNPVVKGSLSGILLPERLVREMLKNAFDDRELRARKIHFRERDPKKYQEWVKRPLAEGLPHYDTRKLTTSDTICWDCDATTEDGSVLSAEDVALDYRARLEYPDEGNSYLWLILGLDCSCCGGEYEVSVTVGFEVEEIVGTG